MKRLFSLSVLLLIFTLSYAQKEVIFNDPSIDKSQIKLEKTIQGIELGVNPLYALPGKSNSIETAGSIELNIRYFHENRIGDQWSLVKSVGFSNTFQRVYKLKMNDDENIFSSTGETQYWYRLSLQAQVEPRWYFSYTNRYRQSKSTDNNAGWYLGVPLTVSYNLYEQERVGYTFDANFFEMNVRFPLSIGYRKSLSENLFLEASFNYSPTTLSFIKLADNPFQVQFSPLFKKHISSNSYHSEIKIAYRF